MFLSPVDNMAAEEESLFPPNRRHILKEKGTDLVHLASPGRQVGVRWWARPCGCTNTTRNSFFLLLSKKEKALIFTTTNITIALHCKCMHIYSLRTLLRRREGSKVVGSWFCCWSFVLVKVFFLISKTNGRPSSPELANHPISSSWVHNIWWVKQFS